MPCLTQHRAAMPCLTQHKDMHCSIQHKDDHSLSHATQRQLCNVPHNTETAMHCPTQHNEDKHVLSHATKCKESCAVPHNTHTALHWPTQHKSETVIPCPTQRKDSWHSTKRRRVSLKQTCRLAAQWQDSTKPRWNRQRQETHLTAQKEGRWLLTPSQPWQLYQKAHSTLAVQHANKRNKLWRLEQFGDHC